MTLALGTAASGADIAVVTVFLSLAGGALAAWFVGRWWDREAQR